MSFGLSRGKEQNIEGFGIDQAELPPVEKGRLDPRQWFQYSNRSFELEIGCGKGTFLVEQSKVHPEVNFLGIEWAGEFYRYAADRMRRHQLSNVKILRTDAAEFIRFRCPDSIADVIHLYFSDPWPKKRHHKRRVIQDHNLIEFHRILLPAGELRLVTDHAELWQWYEEHAARSQHLFERREFQSPPTANEGEVVGTNFERKYKIEGRPLYAMTFVKRPPLSA